MSESPGNTAFSPLGPMLDTLEFVKRTWSQFNVPSSFTPTLDVGELDKRIADLRAVEHWLSMNLNLLQASIRGLEIQRGTVVAVRAFGDALGQSTEAMAQASRADVSAQAASTAQSSPQAAASSANSADPEPQMPADVASSGDSDDRLNTPSASGNVFSSLFGAQPLQLPTGTRMVDPGAWWQLLQGQFNQLAQAALSSATPSQTPVGDSGKRSTAGSRASAKASAGPTAKKTSSKSSGQGHGAKAPPARQGDRTKTAPVRGSQTGR